jgi:hypothetical protein
MRNLFQLQPAFTIEVPLDKDAAVERLRSAITSEELRGFAQSAGTVFDFKIEKNAQRFWSPHLSAQFSPSETGSQLFARFSPRPEIWTMFIAFYFVVMILMSLAAIIAYVQWSLGYTPSALAAVPIGCILIAGLHLGSLIGQSLSADQMDLLRSRFDQAVEIAFGRNEQAT